MEIQTLVVKIAKAWFILLLFFFTSCAAQKNSLASEEIRYSLIEHHYKLNGREDLSQFLYYKTLPIKGNPQFNWATDMGLSEFLNDPFFKKNCNKIQNIFNSNQIEKLDNAFSNLESFILDEKKLSKTILSQHFLQHETYIEVPDKANRKISYPIIITGKNSKYAIFVEDAHNEGGNLYIYEFKKNEWKLICKDSLWLV